MVCRASNRNIWDQPAYKWKGVSTDGGHTWSEPEPLRYDTGGHFFSPATGSRLIRSSENGKLYWIGNIVPDNPRAGLPRHPLQIAETDEKTHCLIEDSVRVIERRRNGDSALVQFSNFRIYEDRETHEFVLTMPRIRERSETDVTSPAYEYRFNVE